MAHIDEYACIDCGEFTDGYMIFDSIWKTVVFNKRDCLCLTHLEKRLGRDLVLSDFPKVQINRPIFLGAVMALKEEVDRNGD